MAYAVYALGGTHEVAPSVTDFVTNNMSGWTATNGSAGAGQNTCDVTIPAGTNSVSRTINILADNNSALTATERETENRVEISFSGGNPVTDKAVCYSPVVPTGNGETDAAPRYATKLHMFGGTVGDATWIAGVIEYTYNRYRHFYIGRIDRYGSYDDGIVLSVSNYANRAPVRDYFGYFDSRRHRHLFSGYDRAYSDNKKRPYCGGLLLSHPDDPHTWRYFDGAVGSGNPPDTDGYGTGQEVFGGPNDGPVDGWIRSGHAPTGTASLITPVVLFGNYDDGAGGRFYRALGSPLGVGVVSMKNLVPEQQIQIGTENWRVFPSAHLNLSMREGTGDYPTYWTWEEPTGLVGFAYKE